MTSLLKYFPRKKVEVDGCDVEFTDVLCFRFDQDHPALMFPKHECNEEYDEINAPEKGKPIQTSLGNLPEKYMSHI
jgi:hypothetical protein